MDDRRNGQQLDGFNIMVQRRGVSLRTTAVLSGIGLMKWRCELVQRRGVSLRAGWDWTKEQRSLSRRVEYEKCQEGQI
jgi:hypothetical protein